MSERDRERESERDSERGREINIGKSLCTKGIVTVFLQMILGLISYSHILDCAYLERERDRK